MSRDHLHRAADELAGLLPVTTPAPWRISMTVAGVRFAALVAPHKHPDRMAGGGWEWDDAYGGCLVAESMMIGDRALLALMRNAAEHLPDLLRAVAEEDPIEVGRTARALAAELCPCDDHASARAVPLTNPEQEA